MSSSQATGLPVVSAQIRIPQHVVYRSFASETVILNLETGKYHGVNPVGGAMLKALESCGTISAAAAAIASEYEASVEQIERDLQTFSVDLAERGLVVIDGADGR